VWADLQRSGLLTWIVEQGAGVALVVLTLLAAAAAVTVRMRKQGRGVFRLHCRIFGACPFSVIILLAYQSAFGHVYERVALLTACSWRAAPAAPASFGTLRVRSPC